MSEQPPWYKNDGFWELVEPIIFTEERIAAAKPEIDHLISLLGIKPGERILDLCCGVGRHSLELAQRGFNVIGIDRTAYFLEKARQNAQLLGLRVEFVLADMAEFISPDEFDIIINMFGSFGYLESSKDDWFVVKNMFTSLRSGGRFLIDTKGREIAARDFQERHWVKHEGIKIETERKPLENWKRIETQYFVSKENNQFEYTISIRSYSSNELSAIFTTSGFSQVQVYGNLAGHIYDREADRLIVVGTK